MKHCLFTGFFSCYVCPFASDPPPPPPPAHTCTILPANTTLVRQSHIHTWCSQSLADTAVHARFTHRTTFTTFLFCFVCWSCLSDVGLWRETLSHGNSGPPVCWYCWCFYRKTWLQRSLWKAATWFQRPRFRARTVSYKYCTANRNTCVTRPGIRFFMHMHHQPVFPAWSNCVTNRHPLFIYRALLDQILVASREGFRRKKNHLCSFSLCTLI